MIEDTKEEAAKGKIKSSISGLCNKLDMSRQNYYKECKKRQRNRVDESLVIDIAKAERRFQPRMGAKKLHRFLFPELKLAGVNLGRDRFIEILYTNGLKLDKLPKSPKVTDSSHSLGVYLNQVKNMDISAPNQAWASDITYIDVGGEFMYLCLIMDMYSRRIVGHSFNHKMKASDCCKALDMALDSLPHGATPVHHSDRGCQYCSHEYVNKLKENGIRISMTEVNHCAENAMAERLNGILKQEYYLGGNFKHSKDAIKAVEQAIHFYNSRRPHLSLNYKTPNQIHFNEMGLVV